MIKLWWAEKSTSEKQIIRGAGDSLALRFLLACGNKTYR